MDRFDRNKLTALVIGAVAFALLLLMDPIATALGLPEAWGVYIPLLGVLAGAVAAVAAYLEGLKDPRPMSAAFVIAVTAYVAAAMVFYLLAVGLGWNQELAVAAVPWR